MSVKKQSNGTYLVDCRPLGAKGARVRKRFDTQGEAKRFLQFTLAQADNKEWQPTKADNRRLDELIALWFNLHVQVLNDGWWKYIGITTNTRPRKHYRHNEICPLLTSSFRRCN